MLANYMLTIILDNFITLLTTVWLERLQCKYLLMPNQQGCNRHWLLPAWKNIASETEVIYAPEDRLLKLKVLPQARKKNLSLPEPWYVRAMTYEVNGVAKTVLTSLPADSNKAK